MTFLLTLFAINYYPNFISKNIIKNDCTFSKIIINKNDTICYDSNENNRFCSTSYIPNEYIITLDYNNNNMNYKEFIHIEPTILYFTKQDKKIMLAQIYYTFMCNNITNDPQLYVNIIPTINNNKSLVDEIMEIYFIINILIVYIMLFLCIFNYHNDYFHEYYYYINDNANND